MPNAGANNLRDALRRLAPTEQIETVLRTLTLAQLKALAFDWSIWARDDQLPPKETTNGKAWRTWLILGGRGSGKTRTGAEWVRGKALGVLPFAREAVGRIALVGETLDAVRAVMIEGVSGLLSIHPDNERPRFEASRRRVVWPNGAIAELFSAEDPDSLRGPQFGAAWCDELCKWRHPQATFDMLQFGLRIGLNPQAVITTTPRPIPLLKKLLCDQNDTVVSRSRTADNAENLSAGFLHSMMERYGGTTLARQELDGDLIEARDDALWHRSWFDDFRVATPPRLQRIVVAVDPPVTSGPNSDQCGLVVAGVDEAARGYVLADETAGGLRPDQWARAAVSLYHRFEADCIVAEVNQGGDLVSDLIRQVGVDVPVRTVRATRGKWVRAEPVAALYAQGRVSHVGVLPDLEDQLADFGADGISGGRSPDRLDALVWALTELMLRRPKALPGVRSL